MLFRSITPRPTLLSPNSSLDSILKDYKLDVRRHYVGSLEHWRSDPTSGPEINPQSFELVVANASAFTLAPDGYPTHARSLKDITVEEHSSPEITFWGENAGQAACSLRRALAIVHDLPDERAPPLSPNQTAAPPEFGAFCDLWSLILVHECILVALCFWIRYLVLLRTPVVIVHSAKVCGCSFSFEPSSGH